MNTGSPLTINSGLRAPINAATLVFSGSKVIVAVPTVVSAFTS
jgi:hypothetical protein